MRIWQYHSLIEIQYSCDTDNLSFYKQLAQISILSLTMHFSLLAKKMKLILEIFLVIQK